MAAEILREDDNQIVIEITIVKHSSFVDCENEIQDRLNEVGCLATARCLENFDTDGTPIIMGNQKFTAKKEKVQKTMKLRMGRFPFLLPIQRGWIWPYSVGSQRSYHG